MFARDGVFIFSGVEQNREVSNSYVAVLSAIKPFIVVV